MTGPDRFFVRACRFLLGVALAGVLLSGCTPSGPGEASGGGCDPNGFGPLSGCDSLDTTSTGGGDGPVGLGSAGPGTEWVVSGFGYSGPRGGTGRHYVECQPADDAGYDQTAYGHGAWKEVDGYRDDGSLNEGDPCPAGGTVYDDGPTRQDGAS